MKTFTNSTCVETLYCQALAQVHSNSFESIQFKIRQPKLELILFSLQNLWIGGRGILTGKLTLWRDKRERLDHFNKFMNFYIVTQSREEDTTKDDIKNRANLTFLKTWNDGIMK